MARIPLPHGLSAIVDDEDLDRVRCFRWYVSQVRDKQIVRSIGEEDYALPQYVLRTVELVGFLNGNPLDCRKENFAVWWGMEWRPASEQPTGQRPRGRSKTSVPLGPPKSIRSPGARSKAKIVLTNGVLHVGDARFGPFASEKQAQLCCDIASLHLLGPHVHVCLPSSPSLYAELVQEVEAEPGPKNTMSVLRRLLQRTLTAEPDEK